MVSSILVLNSLTSAEQSVSVGGHAGITVIDGAYGISNDGLGSKDTSSDFAGFRFLKLILFFRYAFNEKLSIDIRPQIETRGVDGTTGATPKFGKAIGEQRASKINVAFNSFTRAVASYVLPTTTEISVGYLNTRFTWEYGGELFWEDEMNGSPFSCNQWLGDLSDAGIEIVHYFDIGEVTIPLYGYVLNGSGMEEVNRSPVVMLSGETQVGPCKFHLAAAGGTWDENDRYAMFRGSAGMSLQLKKMVVRTEGAIGQWEKRIKGSPDNALPHGAYVKWIVPFSKVVRMSLGFSYVYNNFVNMYDLLPGEEQYLTLTPSFQFLTSSSSRIIMQCDLSDWKQNPSEGVSGEKILRFIHGTVGWRLTF
jgi:hypothetical protein